MKFLHHEFWHKLGYFFRKYFKFSLVFFRRLLLRLDFANRFLLFVSSFLMLIILVFYWGGLVDKSFVQSNAGFWYVFFLSSFAFYVFMYLIQYKIKPASLVFHGVILLILLSLHSRALSYAFREELAWVLFSLAVILIFVITVGEYVQHVYSLFRRTELLFVLSFLFMILLGAILLYLLPGARLKELSFTDAVFISTSAVCVTGLTPVDISSHFTTFGQTLILILIQIGGIGILTFLSFIASSARSNVSLYQSKATGASLGLAKQQGRMFLNAFTVVVFITLLIEIAGAFLLYLSMPDDAFGGSFEKIYVSLFHSVSAFCNAGFSNIPDGLENSVFQQAYAFQFTIAILVILGGLGFFTLNGFLLKIRENLFGRKKHVFSFHYGHLSLSARIIIRMTLVLVIAGLVLFLLLENQHVLSEKSWWEKLLVSFFMSVTPRTAGFSVVDLSILQTPTILLLIFLMWIGASPVSTGGGIKTTTVALAFRALWSFVQNQKNVIIHHRKISFESVRKAFVVVFFSIVIIFAATLFMSVVEEKHGLIPILFEAVSAFGTVGLSLDLTPQLTDFSKIVLVFLMFIGRLGIITVFVAFFKYRSEVLYDVPEEDILI